MKKQIDIILGPANSTKTIKLELDDEKLEVFREFYTYTEELREISIIQKGSKAQLKINWKRGKKISYSTNLPPEDQIIVLMHKIRPFVLNNEPTYFNKVVNILSKHITNKSFRDMLKLPKKLFSGKGTGLNFISNDVLLTSDKMLIKWLNAYEYHKDRDKRREIEGLHKIIPLQATRALLIMMLQDKVKAIFWINNFIKVILGEQDEARVYEDKELKKINFIFKKAL